MHLCNISGAAPITAIFNAVNATKVHNGIQIKNSFIFLSLFFEKHTYETLQVSPLTKSKNLNVQAYDIRSSVHRHRLRFPHNHIHF